MSTQVILKPEVLASIRQYLNSLESAYLNMERDLESCWEHWDDYPLYLCVIDGYQEALVDLNAFIETGECVLPTSSGIHLKIRNFISLTNSLNRSLKSLEPIENPTANKHYQKFLKSFAAFCKIATSLQKDIESLN